MARLGHEENLLLEQDGYGKTWPKQVWVDAETGEEYERSPRKDKYLYGNPELPIASRGDYVVDAIAMHDVVVVVSHTGTGKSTFIPQALYESGRIEGRIIVTQPRIIAARENAHYSRKQMELASGLDLSTVVGYQTATEGDRLPENAIIQNTDGLVLAQMMNEGTITPEDVVIVDEAHERNANIDLTIAAAHKFGIKLVIMSATMDGERAARHAAQARGIPESQVPVIEIPGKPHEIEERIGKSVCEEAIKYAKEKKNILIFVPGAREANATIGRLRRRVEGYRILTLNGDQTIEEQRACFENTDEGKIIVSTSVGQTSITIPDIDVVIDSGWDRVGDYQSGVRSLRVRPVSQATSIQRKGRVGRTKPGIYVRAQLEGYPPIERDRNGNLLVDRYDTPAILRTDLSSIALKLTGVKMTIDDFDLPDMPRTSEIDYAHRKLVRLGAQALGSVEALKVGEEMRGIPLDAHYARMLVESRHHSMDVQLQMAAMLSVCQYEGITMTERDRERWRELSREDRSDMLVQLDVFIKSIGMSKSELRQYNIISQRRNKAIQTLKRLCDDAGLDINQLSLPTEEEREELIGCIITGSNRLFVANRWGGVADGAGFEGRLARSTAVQASGQLIVGTPFELEHMRNSGVKSHRIVLNATVVTPEQLERYTPWRCSYTNEHLELDKNGNAVMSRDLYYDGVPTKRATHVAAEPNHETLDLLVEKIFRERKQFDGMSEQTSEFYAELDNVYRYYVDYSDNAHRYEETIKMLADTVSSWKNIQTAETNELIKIFQRRSITQWLKNVIPHDSAEAQQIRRDAPEKVIYEINGELLEVPVSYKNNEVYATVHPHHVRFFAQAIDQVNGRAVYVRTTSKNYERLDDAVNRYSGVNRASRRSNKKRR